MRTKKILMDDKHIAMPNGVCLASNVHKGWYAIAWYDKNAGKISTMWENKKTLKKMQKEQKELSRDKTFYNRAKKVIAFLIALDLVLIPVAFCPFSHIVKLVFMLPFLLCPIRIVQFILLAFLMTDEEKRYHGAMHMLLNSWCKGKNIKTPLALLQHKQYYNQCKTNSLAFLIVSSGFLGYAYYLYLCGCDFKNMLLIFCICVIFAGIFADLGIFNFLQKFTTLPPTKKEAAVVLAAAKLLLEKEDE